MRKAPSSIFLAALAASLPCASAQVTYLSQLREVTVSASCDYSNGFDVEFEDDSIAAPDFAVFDEFLEVTAASDAGSGTARANHDSSLLPDRITASGYADGNTSGPAPSSGLFAFANASTRCEVVFQTATDLRFDITASLDPTNSGRSSVDLFDSNQSSIYARAANGGSFVALDDTVLLEPGTYTLRITATGSGFSGVTYGSSGSYGVAIDFGDVVQRHCTAEPNSTGAPASIDVTGSTSVSANDFGLLATNAPVNSFGLFFYGPDRAMSPFGDGSLCVGGTIQRLLMPIQIDAAGTAALSVDITEPSIALGPNPIESGSTYSLQFWFRDNAAGGAGFNTSDAIEAFFTN